MSNSLVCSLYCIAENFRKFRGFVAIRESFFSAKFWGCGVLWRCKSEQSAKVFSAKIVFLPIRESFPLYGISGDVVVWTVRDVL